MASGESTKASKKKISAATKMNSAKAPYLVADAPLTKTRNRRKKRKVVVEADVVSLESKYIQRCLEPKELAHDGQHLVEDAAAAFCGSSQNSSDEFTDKLATASEDDEHGGSLAETASVVSERSRSKGRRESCDKSMAANRQQEIEAIFPDISLRDKLQGKTQQTKQFLKRMKSWCKEKITKMRIMKAKDDPNTISDAEDEDIGPNLYYQIYQAHLYDQVNVDLEENSSDIENNSVIQIPEKEEAASKTTNRDEDQGAMPEQQLVGNVYDERERQLTENDTELKILNVQTYSITEVPNKDKREDRNEDQIPPDQDVIPKSKLLENFQDVGDYNLYENVAALNMLYMQTHPVTKTPEKEKLVDVNKEQTPPYHQSAITKHKTVDSVRDETNRGLTENSATSKPNTANEMTAKGNLDKEEAPPYHLGAIPKRKYLDDEQRNVTENPASLKSLDMESHSTSKRIDHIEDQLLSYHQDAIHKRKYVHLGVAKDNRYATENTAELKILNVEPQSVTEMPENDNFASITTDNIVDQPPSYNQGAFPKRKYLDLDCAEEEGYATENVTSLQSLDIDPYAVIGMPQKKNSTLETTDNNKDQLPPFHQGAIPKRRYVYHGDVEEKYCATENGAELSSLNILEPYSLIGMSQKESFVPKPTDDDDEQPPPYHQVAIPKCKYLDNVALEEEYYVIENTAALKSLDMEPYSVVGMPKEENIASTTIDVNKDQPPPPYYECVIPKRKQLDDVAGKEEYYIIENTAALKKLDMEPYSVVGTAAKEDQASNTTDNIEHCNLPPQGEGAVTEHEHFYDSVNENEYETIGPNAEASAQPVTGTEILETIVSQIENEAAALDLARNSASGDGDRNASCDVLERARKITLKVMRICKVCGKAVEFFSCSGETVIMRLLAEHLPVSVSCHKDIPFNICKYCDQCLVECAWMIMDNLRDHTFPRGAQVTFCYICNCPLNDTITTWKKDKKTKKSKNLFSGGLPTMDNSGLFRKIIKKFFKKKQKSISIEGTNIIGLLPSEPKNLGAGAAISAPEINKPSLIKFEKDENSDDSFDSL